jgi:hypothetical protein
MVLAALLIGPIGVVGASDDAPGVPDAWVFGPPTTFPSPSAGWTRFDGEYHPTSGRVYFLGGREGGETYGDVFYFNSATGTYTDTGVDMPVPVSNYDIALLNDGTQDGMYLFGGRPAAGGTVNTTQVYYPATNTAADLTGTDPMPLVATGTTTPVAPYLAVHNNRAYVFGGFENTVPPYHTADTWMFDPTAAAGSRWTNLNAPLNLARAYISTAVANGMIYAIGGDVFDGAVLQSQQIVERLDTANVAAGWNDAAVADLPTPSSGVGGCDESRAFGFNTVSPFTEVAGKVILAGCGQWEGGGASALTDTFIYDIAGNAWQSWEPLNEARRNHAGALIPYSQGTGTPGMWVWGGYMPDGATNTTSSEYRTLTSAPTSVELADFSAASSDAARSWVEPLAWTALLAGVALMGLAFGLSRAQRRRA